MMKRCTKFSFAVLFCAVFTLSAVPNLWAQDIEDAFMLEEVTVTAQKRSENQQKVAIAMETVTGEDIKKLGQTDVEQILQNVSNVIINKASDGLRISLRGLSNDNPEFNGLAASTPTVAVNKDGVYTNRNSSGMDLFDVERVEVLFGPQSTLYATTSPAGVVNIVTANPKLGEYEASGVLEYGSYDLLRTQGVMNVPVADTLALRAAFSTNTRNGYLSNGADDEDSKSARIRMMYAPLENLSIVVTGETLRNNSYGFSGVETFDKQDDVNDPWTADTADAGTPMAKKEEKLYGSMEIDFDFATMSVVPSYVKTEEAGTEVMNFMGNTVTNVREGSGYEKGMEMRLASSEAFSFKWIVGANWYDSSDSSNSNGDDGTFRYATNEQTTYSVYGNTTYPLTERLRATAGLRWTWDENYSYNLESPRPGEIENLLEETTMEYDNPDYKIGFEYDASENAMVFADYSTSFRTQGMGFDADGNPFPNEELDSYTVGAKSRFLNNRLQVNASAYYYDYTNYMASDFVGTLDQVDINGDGDYDDTGLLYEETGAIRDETIQSQDQNAKQVGDARVYGLDIQASYVITDKDLLNVSISYLKSEFTDLYFDYSDVTNSLGIEDQDLSGAEMTNSPNWTISATYSHNFDLPNGGTIMARIDSKYVSEYFLTWNNKEISVDPVTWEPVITSLDGIRTQEAYHLSNFSAVYNHPDGNWSLTGYVKNIENYAVKRSYMMNSLIINSPRTIGAVVSVKF